MTASGKKCSERLPRPSPATAIRYREATKLYAATDFTCVEISRRCGVSLSGFKGYIHKYRRDLLLARYGIRCSSEEAANTCMGQCRGQRPAARAKYSEAMAACDSMDYIAYNVSQIARSFGLDGTNLGKQLRMHCPGVIERREQVRQRLGLGDNLPRGTRPYCWEQYAEAVELLRGERYVTMQEAAERCDVSYPGLKQHLAFYHEELVNERIGIRKQAAGRRCESGITGRGSVRAPRPETVEKYAEALRLYRTTLMSARQIALQTGVSKKGFYEYLQKWNSDLVCRRRNIPCEEERAADRSKARKYNPATAAKYAEAIRRLKESDLPTAEVAAQFGLHPEVFRQYLKAHEPELYARQGMMRVANGRSVSRRSMAKYAVAIRLYGTTSESLKAIARRLDLNYNSLGSYIRRNHQELIRNPRQRAGGARKSETQVGTEESVHLLVIA